MPLVKGYIGFLSDKSGDVQFQYNPEKVERSDRYTYAHNQAAYADLPNNTSKYPSLEWVRNEPEEIAIDLLFFERGKKNVEDKLKKLDKLSQPDRSTGAPRDLVLSLGVRSDRVRITQKNVVEDLFDEQLNVQRARVSLRMTALKSRTR